MEDFDDFMGFLTLLGIIVIVCLLAWGAKECDDNPDLDRCKRVVEEYNQIRERKENRGGFNCGYIFGDGWRCGIW